MVFPGDVIEFSIINEHTASYNRSSRYELISFILDNSHTPFLRNDLDGTNLITIQNWIDNSGIK